MFGLLKFLFLDRRARKALKPRPVVAASRRHGAPAVAQVQERTSAQALAEAEERMKRLPPEKAQLIRTAMALHRVRQTVLDDLSDDERERMREIAEKAFLGGGKSG